MWHELTHRGQDKMAAISQTTLSNAFPLMQMFVLIQISLRFVPKGLNDQKSSLI